jgi:hypothetical protein
MAYRAMASEAAGAGWLLKAWMAWSNQTERFTSGLWPTAYSARDSEPWIIIAQLIVTELLVEVLPKIIRLQAAQHLCRLCQQQLLLRGDLSLQL